MWLILRVVGRVTCRHGKLLVRVVLLHILGVHKVLRLVSVTAQQVFLVQLMDGFILDRAHLVSLYVTTSVGVLLDHECSGTTISCLLIHLSFTYVVLNFVGVAHIERLTEAFLAARRISGHA